MARSKSIRRSKPNMNKQKLKGKLLATTAKGALIQEQCEELIDYFILETKRLRKKIKREKIETERFRSLFFDGANDVIDLEKRIEELEYGYKRRGKLLLVYQQDEIIKDKKIAELEKKGE